MDPAAPKPAPNPAPNPAPVRFPFTGGHGDPGMVPVDLLSEAADAAIRREGARLALYHMGGDPLGHAGLRAVIAAKLARRRGIAAEAADVLVTGGSNQGIDPVVRLLLEPGDTVLVESFCYEGALKRFRARGAEVLGMRLDAGGIDTDGLAAQLAALEAAGRRPKLIYTIPTVQNPTGSILSLERRHALLALAGRHGIPVVEDECYADVLWSDAPAPPALKALAPGGVIHIGSFSKSLAPALRLGYVVADPALLAPMLAFKTDGGTGALDQIIAAEFAARHFDAHAARLAGGLRRKMHVMLEALDRAFGTEADVIAPQGGLFVWVRLGAGIDVRDLAGPAAAAGITFNPGPQWSVDAEAGSRFLRLCFALPDDETIREGVAALAQVCRDVTGRPARSGNVALPGGAEARG